MNEDAERLEARLLGTDRLVEGARTGARSPQPQQGGPVKQRLRIIVEVEVEDPSEFEKQDLRVIIEAEGGMIADEVFGTVFGKQYRYVQSSFDIL